MRWQLVITFNLGRPLFPGSSNQDQLLKIFQTLGTPDENVWPGLKDMPDYTANYPIYPRQDLLQIIPKIERQGIDLLEKMLEYDPDRRILAADALNRNIS